MNTYPLIIFFKYIFPVVWVLMTIKNKYSDVAWGKHLKKSFGKLFDVIVSVLITKPWNIIKGVVYVNFALENDVIDIKAKC